MVISKIVHKLLEEGPVCDHCLGRQLSKLSTGLSNDERGHAAKLFMALEGAAAFLESGDDSLLKTLSGSSVYARKSLNRNDLSPDETCWICLDIFKEMDNWSNRVATALKGIEFNTFLIGTKPGGLLSENEEIVWELCGSEFSEPLKSEINREIGKRVSQITGKNVDFNNPDVTVVIDIAADLISVQIRSLYISGRYCKYIRGIPQTHWPCRECRGRGCPVCSNSGKQYSESVEELIAHHLIPLSMAESTAFHGAGREDIDALMLGSGRPFVIEAKSPHIRSIDLSCLSERVNKNSDGKIEISNLKFCDKSFIEHIKGEKADKTYRLKIRFDSPVSFCDLSEKLQILNGSTICQETPKRVLHRRADLCRQRKIHSVTVESVEEMNAFIRVHCDGGLYVKELTSGDDGRTQPNISDIIGIPAVVEELDVIDVNI